MLITFFFGMLPPMLRTSAVLAALVAGAVLPALARDIDQKATAAAIAADVRFAEQNCPGMVLDMDTAMAFILRGISGEELRGAYLPAVTAQYRKRIAAVELFGQTEACRQIVELYAGSGIVRRFVYEPIVALPRPEPEEYRSLYEFELDRFPPEERKAIEYALLDTLIVCPLLVDRRDLFKPVEARIHDDREEPEHAILFPGAEAPWLLRYEMRFRVDGKPPAQYAHWLDQHFSIYMNADRTEISATGNVGRDVCNVAVSSDGDNLARQFR